MQRLLVVLLAAVDAAIAAAVGLAVILAPLTLLWTVAFGSGWGVLWPLTGALWQFGHGVPLDIAIPDDALVALGVPTEAAQFTLSLTPLAFLLLTFFLAARSGSRAARSGAGLTGVLSGTVVFSAFAALVALTSGTAIAGTSLLLGILLPAAVYLAGSFAGAVRYAWEE